MAFDFFEFLFGNPYIESATQAGEDQARAARDMDSYRERAEEAQRRLFGPGNPATPPKRKTYDCTGCGAPLFGMLNENCQYCKRPGGQE